MLTADPAVTATDRFWPSSADRSTGARPVPCRDHGAGGTVARRGRDALTLPDGRVGRDRPARRAGRPPARRPLRPPSWSGSSRSAAWSSTWRRRAGSRGAANGAGRPRRGDWRPTREPRPGSRSTAPWSRVRGSPWPTMSARTLGRRHRERRPVRRDDRPPVDRRRPASTTVSIRRDDAITAAIGVVDELLATGALVRDGDRVRLPGAAPVEPGHDPALEAAMDRLGRPRSPWWHRRRSARPHARPAVHRAASASSSARRGSSCWSPTSRTRCRPIGTWPRSRCAWRRAAAHAGGLPRCHRDEPQVRDGDPRRPRPSGDPPADAGGPRPGTEGADVGRGDRDAMTIPSRDRGAIVLAGGRSSRFGRDKLSSHDRRHGHARSRHRCRPDVASVVVVVLAPDDPRTSPTTSSVSTTRTPMRVRWRVWRSGSRPAHARSIGPSSSAATCRAFVRRSWPCCWIAWIPPSTWRCSTTVSGRGPCPVPSGRPSPAPPRPPCSRTGERRLRALSSRLATVAIDLAEWRGLDPAGETLRDIDVPDDLVTPD